ncbi:hypothetical protein [Streptomyces sp. NPDC005385]|uniref:hypothetical protein n=1 Tax=Streptomyces sp. NPDC005385 TaxID=3157039 RepID=UPI0033B5E7CE
MPDTTKCTVADIAPQVARHLGDGWTATPSTQHYDVPFHTWYVTHTDGTALRLTLTEYTGNRLSITGEFPDIPPLLGVDISGYHRGHATADPARPAASIARQIERHVLPVLRESLALLQLNLDAAQRLESDKEAVRAQLKAIPDLDAALARLGNSRGTHPYAVKTAASVTVKGDQDGAYVGIEMRGLTGDHAERVLRALIATT